MILMELEGKSGGVKQSSEKEINPIILYFLHKQYKATEQLS